MQRIKRKNFFSVFPLAAFLIPLLLWLPQTVQASEPKELIPVGQTVGVTLDTKGLLVLGTGFVRDSSNETYEPSKGVLKIGDLILQADGKNLENKEAFLQAVEGSGGRTMELLLERDGRQKEVKITPIFSTADNAFKLGVWIRDSIQGIGTVTYYDPESGTFGALGHGVYDVDTDALMTIREGSLVDSDLTEIVKGHKGTAGELMGKVNMEEKLAHIQKNTEVGIYGTAENTVFQGEALPVATAAEVKKGKAVLLSDLEGGAVQEYAMEIESISRSGGKSNKDMTIRITDERLLNLTGGIVQGMSGSPIVQDGKLVGAVTHVMLNEPAKGYGTFIETMLAAA
ncbi:MAG: SpoIVB peptidase [Anaerotignum sp.]